MNGWVFIALGLFVIAGGSALGGFLIHYGSDLRAKARVQSAPTVSVGAEHGPINIVGNSVVQITFAASPPASSPAPTPTSHTVPGAAPLVENASFEQGLVGWGTGWFEDQFPEPTAAPLAFNGAQARWYIDTRRHRTGSHALRVEHETPYSPHVYSCFSQKLMLTPNTRYEVSFWLLTESVDAQGGLVLRVLPSRAPTPQEWDRRKVNTDNPTIGEWTPYRAEFDSAQHRYFDVRFFAEGRIRAWIDDVQVRELPAPVPRPPA